MAFAVQDDGGNVAGANSYATVEQFYAHHVDRGAAEPTTPAAQELTIAGSDATETVIWLLPEATTPPTDSAEDRVYRLLDDGDPGPCAQALDDELAGPPPAGFTTGARAYHLFRAAAHLCQGQRQPAEQALRRAVASDWSAAPDRVTAERVCTVWSQVTTLLEGIPRDCPWRSAEASSG